MQNLVKKEYKIPFILVTSLFFLWGFAHAILDVLKQTLSRCAGYYTCPFGMGTGHVLPGLFRDGYSCRTVYQ